MQMASKRAQATLMTASGCAGAPTMTLPWNSPELSVAATTSVTGSSSSPAVLLTSDSTVIRTEWTFR